MQASISHLPHLQLQFPASSSQIPRLSPKTKAIHKRKSQKLQAKPAPTRSEKLKNQLATTWQDESSYKSMQIDTPNHDQNSLKVIQKVALNLLELKSLRSR